jgi:hypothetical protein
MLVLEVLVTMGLADPHTTVQVVLLILDLVGHVTLALVDHRIQGLAGLHMMALVEQGIQGLVDPHTTAQVVPRMLDPAAPVMMGLVAPVILALAERVRTVLTFVDKTRRYV